MTHRVLASQLVIVTLMLSSANDIFGVDIATDGTLGNVESFAGPNAVIPSHLGQRTGKNLFHSFDRFSIGKNESASFVGPDSIDRVISRVTGGTLSKIDGRVASSIQGADFYFVNPAGIVFGPNATVDVSGASYFSTASRIVLEDGGVFDAESTANSVLTAEAPVAFGFLRPSVASISAKGIRVTQESGNLTLVGGDIDIDHAATATGIVNRGDDVYLISVASDGYVPLGLEEKTDAALERFEKLGTITLHRRHTVVGGDLGIPRPTIDTSSGRSFPGESGNAPIAGSVYMRAGNILVDSAEIRAANAAGMPQDALAIDIAARDSIAITAGNLPAQVSAVTEGDGATGGIRIAAREVSVIGNADNTARISSDSTEMASDKSGGITINARSVVVANGALVSSDSRGSGDGGAITITSDSLSVLGRDKHAAVSTNAFGSGNGGSITIDTKSLTLIGGAVQPVPDQPAPRNRAPKLTGLVAESTQSAIEDANSGAIEINAGKILIAGGAVISTHVFSGQGDAGEISITASELALTGDAAAQSRISASIGADPLSASLPTGAGGNVSVVAGFVDMVGPTLISAQTAAPGSGGDVSIQGEKIALRLGAIVSAESTGTGDAGNVSISLSDELLGRGGGILSNSEKADGGNIDIQVRRQIDLQNSEITTTVRGGQGNGGNIFIDPDFIVLESSNITANAFGGAGGNIDIKVGTLIQSPDSSISASSAKGIDGTVRIDVSNDQAVNSTAPLPSDYQPDGNTRRNCTRFPTGPTSISAKRYAFLPQSPEDLRVHWARSLRLANRPSVVSDLIDNARVAIQSGLASMAHRQLVEADAIPDKTLSESVRILATKSDLALRQRRLDRALSFATQAVDIADDAESDVATLESLNALGNAEYSRGNYPQAIGSYESGLRLLQKKPRNPAWTAVFASNAARTAAQNSDRAAFSNWVERARNALSLMEDSHFKIGELLALAVTAQQLLAGEEDRQHADFAMGQSIAQEAIGIAEQFADRKLASYAKGILAELLARKADPDSSRSLLSDAFLLSTQIDVPYLQGRWLWRLAQLERRRGNRNAAKKFYAAATARLEAANHALVYGYRGDPEYFERTVRSVYLEQADLLLALADASSTPSIRTSLLNSVRSVMEGLKRTEIEQYFLDDCVYAYADPGTQSIDELIEPGAAAIYPIVLNDRLVSLVSLPEGRTQVLTTHISRNELERVVTSLHDEMTPAGNPRRLLKASGQLHKWIIEPIRHLLDHHEINTLVVVPDGILRAVPFAALHDGSTYLIERYAVSVSPGLLMNVRRENAQSETYLLAGLSEPRQGAANLPHVSAELAEIGRLHKAELMLDDDFHKHGLEYALSTRGYAGIVLATHSYVGENPHESYLLSHDGRISLADLEQLLRTQQHRFRSTDLLILSACDTALGDERAAMGLAGIGVQSGTPTVLATLWSVNDQSTSMLVPDFLRRISRDGTSRSQGLRQAQLALLDNPRYQHPYYWAPFMLIGAWN